MASQTILSSPAINEKLLQALLMLLCLKGIAKGFIIGGVLTVCLCLYTLVADALVEVTSHIGLMWATSDSITRLLLLCLAVYIVKKLFPYVLLLYKRGIV